MDSDYPFILCGKRIHSNACCLQSGMQAPANCAKNFA